MLSISNLKNAAQAAGYYEKDNYYLAGEGPSGWWGKAAESLGLQGRVDQEEFEEILEGHLPDGTEFRKGHRPGTDLTFSAPKSVSLMALVEGDERILKAHREAVSEALAFLEGHAARTRETRQGQTEQVKTGNLLVARFDHDTSRELDPQLHTHCVVLNATRREDGEYRSLDNELLFRNKMLAGALYRAELADRLRGLGYEIEVQKKNGEFELVGFTREQIEAFSLRRQQILERMAERGLTTAEGAAMATLDTRRAKQPVVDRDALHQEWKIRAREAALELRIPERSKKPKHIKFEKTAVEQVEKALEHFFERGSVVRYEEILRRSLERGTGSVTFAEVAGAIRDMVEQKKLLSVGEGRFTTREALALEEKILGLAREGQDKFAYILEGKELKRELAERKLTSGQEQAARLVLTTRDQVTLVQGYAGTGKTTMLRCVHELAERAGYEVTGYSNTAAAAAVLESESGIQSHTLASKVMSSRFGLEESERPKIWIVDEASMMGTKQTKALFELAKRQGARLVLVGDRQQLPAIEAGKPFALLQDRGAKVATMSEVMRQKTRWLKKIVDLVIGRKDQRALEALGKSVREVPDRATRLDEVAKHYLEKIGDGSRRLLMITGTNADRKALNDLVRAGLEEKGELRGGKAAGEILINRSFTESERKDTHSYQAGDVVRFDRGYKKLGVSAGEYLTVESVDRKYNTVRLRGAGERRVDWEPWRFKKVEVYQAEQRDLRVGDHVRFTRNDRETGRKNGEAGRVVELDEGNLTAVVETELVKGQPTRHKLDLRQDRHWEHGYASTIYASQGGTADEVVIHIDTSQKQVTGHEAWYVALTRAKSELTVYTDSKEKLPGVIGQVLAKESAIEAVEKSLGKGKDLEIGR